MEVDTRLWTQYSACNLCNGSDPFTHKPCETGSYVCDPDSGGGQTGKVDRKGVGVTNVTKEFAPTMPSNQCVSALEDTCGQHKQNSTECYGCVWTHNKSLGQVCQQADPYDFCPSGWQACNGFHSGPEWACWDANIPRKTGGWWFSTLAEGQCNETSAPGTCGWKVHAMKTVKADCLSDVLVSTVESYDKSGCFHECGSRNETSPCWIGCFFDTLLGEDARHSVAKPLGGMSAAEIEKCWTNAFLPKDQGGCDEIEIPYSWEHGAQLLV